MLTRRHVESRMVKAFKHLFSGLVYGGIALNSKVTSLALLPILAVWSLAHLYCHITVLETVRQQGLRKKTDSHAGTDDVDGADAIEDNRSGVVRPSWTFLLIEWLGLHGVLFLIGALAGHLPWLLWYHVRPLPQISIHIALLIHKSLIPNFCVGL